MAETPQEQKVENKYVGAVQGNILDAYHNHSYNLKLYMIKDLDAPPSSDSPTNNDTTTRDENSSGDSGGAGGYMNGYTRSSSPKNTVVIAQTGVTGVQIDNLEMEFKRGPNMTFLTNVEFELIQPGAADLLDQLQLAKKYLGIEGGIYTNTPLFLEINFKGYTNPLDEDETAGGEITNIIGPFVYRLELISISLTIDATGSRYQVVCKEGATEAFDDKHFRLPRDVSSTGKTIEDHLQKIQDDIAKYREENYVDNEVQDQVIIDTSQLKKALNDTNLDFDNAEAAETINRIMNARAEGASTREELQKRMQEEEEKSSSDRTLDAGLEVKSGFLGFGQKITYEEGIDLHKIIVTLLVMNNSYHKLISRKIGDPSQPAADPDDYDREKAFTKWFKINATVEYIKFDKKRREYAKKITYTPIIYDTADESLAGSSTEMELDENQISSRINKMNIKKAYHYLFTGLNDQIINVDISYKHGHLLLLPPGGGLIGDISTSPVAPGVASIPPGKDPSGVADRNSLKNAKQGVDDIKNLFMNSPDSLNRLSDRLGLSSEQRSELQQNEQRQQSLAENIANLRNRGIDVLNESGTQSNAPVEDGSGNPTQNNPNSPSGTYTPEASGYVYSADFISDQGNEVLIGDIEMSRAIADLKKIATTDTEPNPRMGTGPFVQNINSATSDGGVRNNLFTYMYQNSIAQDMLINLDLTVRGDPWYLGEPGVKKYLPKKGSDMKLESSDDGINYSGNDNYFLFETQTPRLIDPDVEDEDNNTGLMASSGKAYFISGVYQIISTTVSFRSGQFECAINGKKQTALKLSKADLVDIDYGTNEE